LIVAKALFISSVAGVNGIFFCAFVADGAPLGVAFFVGAVFGGAVFGAVAFFAFFVVGAGVLGVVFCLAVDDFCPGGLPLGVVVFGGVGAIDGPTDPLVVALVVRLVVVAAVPAFAGVLNDVPGTAVVLLPLAVVLVLAML
jgi:hypothetical protein